MKRIVIAAMLMAASQAYAAGGSKVDKSQRALWESECGSCHIAYPARFLDAETWQRLMTNLGDHFGDDASLDQETSSLILHYLQRHASRHSRHRARSMRISDTAWFRHEHDEITSTAWHGPVVRSPANCTICHVNAARGDWSERGVRMPAGVSREEDEEHEHEHEHDDDD